MADVFISYAHVDRERIEKLAHALEADGLSVWWDRRIDAGSEFSQDIERELNAAKAVIVVWSAAGNASPWVRDEASFARVHGKLLPIRLDSSEPPLGFQQFHAFDFSRWRGDVRSEEFRTLQASLARRIAGETAEGFEPRATAAPRDVIARLRRHPRLALAVGVVAAFAVLAAVYATRIAPAPEPAGKPEAVADATAKPVANGRIGLAVLPFTNLSSDPEQEHFADGLTEELLNWLGNVEGLKVPGRTSSFQFKGKSEDLRAIGETLNVDYLLEGSVRRSGDALRITAQLIEAKSGYHLWSETYDRELADIFAIQDEIARMVVTELLGKIPESGAENPAAVGDVDPRSHELYLEGRALLTRRRWVAAFEKFRASVALDPRHAFAQAYLAVVAANSQANGIALPGVDDLDAPIRLALAQAVRLKPNASDTLFAQGWVAEMRSGVEMGSAIRDPAIIEFYDRAVRANPRHVEAMHALTRAAGISPDRKIELYERVLEIDPGHRSALTNLTRAYLDRGDREKALRLARRALTLADAPLSYVAISGKDAGDAALVGEALFADWEATDRHLFERVIRASHLATLGAVDEARFLFAREAKAERPWAQWNRINVAILDRDHAAALAAARDMHETEDAPAFSAWALALALIASGEPDRAYAALLEARPDLLDPAQAKSVRDRVAGERGEFGDAEIVTAAHALDLAGRRGEARILWQAALAAAQREPPRTWRDHLNLSLLHGRLGDKAAAIRGFKAAYDAGFRYLWSYDCDACVHDGFFSENGLFAELLEIPEIVALVERIKAENAQTLEQFNKQYGVLDKVRAMMGQEAVAAEP